MVSGGAAINRKARLWTRDPESDGPLLRRETGSDSAFEGVSKFHGR